MGGQINTYEAKDYPGSYGNPSTPFYNTARAPSPMSETLPDPNKQHGYDPELGMVTGYAARRDRLMQETAAQRAKQAIELNRLRAYATGEKSMARDQAGVQRGTQKSAYESMGRTAQRGGRSESAQTTTDLGTDQAMRTIGAQSVIAQKLERQRAAQAYAAASQSALKSGLGVEKLGRGYAQLGIQDKDRWNAYRRNLEALYGQKRGAAIAEDLAKSREEGAYITGTVGAVTGAVGSFVS